MTRLLAYIRVIIKWRKLIFYNTLAITLLAVGISLILPQRFSAAAQILPPSDEDPFGMGSLLGGGLGTGRLGRLSMGMLGGSTSSDLMVGILTSRTVMTRVVEQCSITSYYRVRKNSMEEATKLLRKMTAITVNDEGIVKVVVDAKTPALAARIANTYVAELDVFLRYNNVTKGRNMRQFVEKRLSQVDSALALAQESLRSFQQENRVLAVDQEAVAAIDAYAKLKSELYARQAQLDMAQQFGSPDNPYVTMLRSEVSSFRDQLGTIERGGSGRGFGAGFGVSFEKLPSVAAEYLRRYRDFKIQEEAYAMLYQQYEYARIMEVRDMPAVTVLDRAIPPERRSYPRRWFVVILAFSFGLLAGIGLVFVCEYFEHISIVRPDEYRGWQEVRGQLALVAGRLAGSLARKKN